MKNTVSYPEGHVLLRNLSKAYPIISHGKGVYLYDTTGKRYLDAAGGALVSSIGHGNEEVAQEVFEQMRRVPYVNGQQFTSPVMESFADRLAALAPEGLNRVALLSSGSEAVEAAIKFARQLCVERGQHSKTKLIARNPGYHGNTLFALSASARPHYKKIYGPLLNDVLMIEAPYGYRCPVDYKTKGAEYYAAALEKCIQANGAENIMAFIFEPVIGSSAGGSTPPPGYYEKVSEICRKNKILMIADEILCGSGRTGKFFACEHYNIKPDVIVLGKGINGGVVPMSVLLVKDEHLKEMKSGTGYFQHAQTYLQSPSMAAAGLAVLRFYEKNQLVKNSETVGAYLHEKLKSEIATHPNVGSIAGIGLLAGVEFVEDRKTKKPFDRKKKVTESFVAKAFEKGLILWPNVGQADGVNGDLVMLGPPLIISKTEVDELVSLLKETLHGDFGA